VQSEMKKLVIANKEISDKLLESEKQLRKSESENKQLLIEKENSQKQASQKQFKA